MAELRPLSLESEDLEGRLERLAARGVLVADEVTERRPLAEFEPVQSSGAAASDAILEDREDRV